MIIATIIREERICTTYVVKDVRSPISMSPTMTCCPPNQTTASVVDVLTEQAS